MGDVIVGALMVGVSVVAIVVGVVAILRADHKADPQGEWIGLLDAQEQH